MTDKKLTDEEIIKRLEYVRKNADEGYIAHFENGGEVDKNEEEYIDILCGTLDLIDRQKTEIERLKSELSNTRRKALLEAASKFAGHSNYHGDTILCKLICMAEGKDVGIAKPLDISEIKAEANKEFAEKLKNKCYEDFQETYEMLSPYVTDDDIDNLLKEMVGEEE